MNLKGFSRLAVEHAFKPHNRGALERFNGHACITGPCGDTMEFWVLIEGGVIRKVSFVTDGCEPSLACGSMATVLAEGCKTGQVLKLNQRSILDALGGLPQDHGHCALLAVTTLKAAIEEFMKERVEETDMRAACAECENKECSAHRQRANESDEDFARRQRLNARMCRIKHKIVVLSGKGGVGKSTVAVNLAAALKLAGMRVGLLDIDLHGPSIPTMLGLEGVRPMAVEGGFAPVDKEGLKVMSIGFLLADSDDAVIWRGPRKMGAIQQFLSDVAWGDLDYLVVDTPPGTGDEQLSLCQLVEGLEGAVIVTTPQKVASADARKSINFCRALELPVLGVVENMSGFVCPKCGELTQMFCSGGGDETAKRMNVAFLGKIPMDPQVAQACDSGRAFITEFARTATAERMAAIIQALGLQYG